MVVVGMNIHGVAGFPSVWTMAQWQSAVETRLRRLKRHASHLHKLAVVGDKEMHNGEEDICEVERRSVAAGQLDLDDWLQGAAIGGRRCPRLNTQALCQVLGWHPKRLQPRYRHFLTSGIQGLQSLSAMRATMFARIIPLRRPVFLLHLPGSPHFLSARE